MHIKTQFIIKQLKTAHYSPLVPLLFSGFLPFPKTLRKNYTDLIFLIYTPNKSHLIYSFSPKTL